MTLQQRISVLVKLGEHLRMNDEEWQLIKQKASSSNPWFVPEFVEQAATAIILQFLQRDKLESWTAHYHTPFENKSPALVGLVMAGNIPMVGFHDMLCIFITGHIQRIKLSSKDEVLITYLVKKMEEFDGQVSDYISIAEKLLGCQVYIATGSNNTSRYFDYYFGKFPHIIRRNRTSVAILDGSESFVSLDKLSDDIQMYFGLGCRSVTKLYLPENYNFEPLLEALNKYERFGDYHKYRHNYDYQLALLMMANKLYMTNGTILITESPGLFTAISQLNYEVYFNKEKLLEELKANSDVQCIISKDEVPFGAGQYPTLNDYADGVDTMKFLLNLPSFSPVTTS